MAKKDEKSDTIKQLFGYAGNYVMGTCYDKCFRCTCTILFYMEID